MLDSEERKESRMTFHHHHRLDGCEWCEACNDRQGLWGAFFLGLGVFALGVILILDNFGVVDAGWLLAYWPMLLIILGISHLVGPLSARKLGWGLSWIAVGAIILLDNLGVIAVGIQVLWPVVLVILGANLLLCGAGRRLGWFEREGGKDDTEK
jgi:hypothetical protein